MANRSCTLPPLKAISEAAAFVALGDTQKHNFESAGARRHDVWSVRVAEGALGKGDVGFSWEPEGWGDIREGSQ